MDPSSYTKYPAVNYLKTHTLKEISHFAKKHPKEAADFLKITGEVLKQLKDKDSEDFEDLRLRAIFLIPKERFPKTTIFINTLRISTSSRKELIENRYNIKSWRLKAFEPIYTNLLFAAIYNEDLKEVRSLHRNTSYDNEGTLEGFSPLHVALKVPNPNVEIIKYLIQNGAALDAKDKEGNTPLHLTVQAQNPSIEIVEVLLSAGALVNAKNSAGHTPLHLAAACGNKDICERLLNSRASLRERNNEGNTPLHEGILGKNPLDIFDLFVRFNAPLNARGKNGLTPLHFAVNKGNREIVEKLVSFNASLEAKDNEGETPLFMAIKIADKVDTSGEVVELLLKNGASVIAKNNLGDTPLHIAAYIGKRELCEQLVRYNASPDAKNKKGLLPLELAILSENSTVEVIKWFREKVPLVVKDENGFTLLHLACLSNNPFKIEIINLLIASGADFYQANNEGITCALMAMMKGTDITKNIAAPIDPQEISYNTEFIYRFILTHCWKIEHRSAIKETAIHFSAHGPATLKFATLKNSELFKKFANHPQQAFDLHTFRDHYEESLRNAEDSVSEIQNKFKLGKSFTFITGMPNHAISVTFQGDYMVVGNRGFGRQPSSLKAFKIDRSKGLDDKQIAILKNSSADSIEFFYEELPESLGYKKAEPDFIADFLNQETQEKDQSFPSCWWLAQKLGVYAFLSIEALLNVEKSYFDEISKIDAYLENYSLAKAVYKQFSEFSFIQLLTEYLEYSTDDVPRDFELVEKILRKLKTKEWRYIFKKEEVTPITITYWKNFFLKTKAEDTLMPFFQKEEIIQKARRFLENQPLTEKKIKDSKIPLRQTVLNLLQESSLEQISHFAEENPIKAEKYLEEVLKFSEGLKQEDIINLGEDFIIKFLFLSHAKNFPKKPITNIDIAKLSPNIKKELIKKASDLKDWQRKGLEALYSALLLNAIIEGNLEDVKTLCLIPSLVKSSQAKVLPLYLAILAPKANLEIIHCLIHHGALINAEKEGDVSLHLANLNRIPSLTVEIVELLLKGNASLEEKNEDGLMPLHGAVLLGNREICERLLSFNASSNSQNAAGQTPLHLALLQEKPSIDIIELLLKANASIDVKDNNGVTPLQIAIDLDDEEIFQQFRKFNT